jgi:hypothetical protein
MKQLNSCSRAYSFHLVATMRINAQTFEPMTLANMRESGVLSLWVRCGALHCNHGAVLDVSAYANELAVPSFGSRMV